jgi:very-short-patch-repair endonuclease
VLQLCDGRSGSVLESVHRVQLVLAGLTGFTPQLLVRDLPALRVDFAWQEAGLVVEVDGARWHVDPARDRARDNALAGLGWRVLRYTWAEVVHDEARVLAEIAAALSAGGPRTQLVRVGLAAAS